MLICPNCGTANTDDSKFCENCGTKLEGEAQYVPEETGETKVEPAAEPENAPNMESDEEPTAGPEQAAEPEEEQVESAERPEEQVSAFDQPVEPEAQPEPEQWQQGSSDQGFDPGMDQGFDPGMDQGFDLGVDQNYDPNMNQGFDQDFTQNMAAGGAPRKKMSRLQIAVILEAVCLVLLVVAFFTIGNSRSSAISVAEKYFEAYADQDWEEVYGMLELPDGDFIQEDQYEKIMDASEQPEITNFQVREPVGNVGDGITQTFEVNYSINGQGQSSTTVTVVKQSRKSMLFFDTWKVSADGLIAQDYSIYVPKGAQTAVDGVQLTEDYLVSEEEGQACYQISIFNGVHSIQAEIPWCETYEAQFDTTAQAEYAVSGLALSEEGTQAVETKLQEAMEAYCQAALAGSSFDEVKDLFAEGAPDSNEDYYENLRNSLEADKYSSAQQLQLSGFECDVSEVGTYNGSLQTELSYDYDVIYTYQGLFDDAPESRTKDGSSYASAQFVYDGDTYKLWSFTPGSIWY